MYFSNELAGEVVDRLNSCLITDGWLVVSPQEISYAQRPGFIQIKQSSVFLFKKGTELEEKGKSPLFFSEISDSVISPVRYFKPDFRKTPVTTIVSSGHDFDSETDLLDNYTGEYNPTTILTQDLTRITLDKSSEPVDEMRGENPLISIQNGHLADAEYLLMQPEYQNRSQLPTIEMLARIFADQGDIDRALGWCDRILGIDPLYPGAYYLRGIIEQDQGNSVAAVQSLRQALYADPNYLPAYLMLGTITGAQGKKAEARRHYQVVLKLLAGYTDDTPVDKTEGMPAGQVREMVMKLLDGMPLS
jgi:chemotaxis protein methyltransferase CheR